MNDLPEVVEIPLKLRVPRSMFVVAAPVPATVTQKTAEQHFGTPPRLFKEMARDGLFPVKRMGRLIFAAYDDVKRAVTEGAVARSRVEKAIEAAVDEPESDAPMSIDAAHSYLESARTSQEQRERKKEIEAKAWELMHAYGEKLDDDTPNPKHHKAKYEQGMDLLLATMGLQKKGAPTSSVSAPHAGRGYYRQCCWCDRPAYATKQTWYADKWYWSGGPVCEVCAKRRAPNERVVQIEERKILLHARDPTVPKDWNAPRRRGRRKA